MPAGVKELGMKPLCLPGGTSLFPRKISFLWNKTPQMGDYFGNDSVRCFDNHEKLSVREQHHQGCSTGKDRSGAEAPHYTGRSVSSLTECIPRGLSRARVLLAAGSTGGPRQV